MLKTLVIALTFPILASIPCAGQEIDPAGKISGKISDPALQVYRPASGIVSDTTTWRKLWGAWRPLVPLKNVDFQTHIVLVETADGPNNVIASLLKLDDEGNLKYEVASTRMAGPGFGYLMLIVPKKDVRKVNGRFVAQPGPDRDDSAIDPDMAAKESVFVEIVGRVRTGVMSIGGETTGTLVAANGIVWELELQDDQQLIEAVNGLGASLAVIRGELTKKTGVEIRERWIVTVQSLAALDQNPRRRTNENAKEQARKNQPVASEAPISDVPIRNGFKLISISTSGGIAGTGASQTIAADGTVKYEDIRQNISDTWSIEPATLNKLHQFVAETDWDRVPKLTRAENVADAYNFTISIETPKGVTRIFIDGPSLPTQPTIQQLFSIIRRPPKQQ